MFIRIRNLVTYPVSLPGPLPRLRIDDDITTEIAPKEYDLIKEELASLVANKSIQLFVEAGGSVDGNFVYDNLNGTLSYQGTQIAPNPPSASDKVRVTVADTTPGFLDDTIVPGTGLVRTILNPGGDEQYKLDVSGAPPLVHATSHQDGGSDEISVAGLSGELADAQTPKSHASTHNAGGGDVLAIDAVAGTGSLRTLGTAATSACAGNDLRLSDARTPTAHASTHQNGGSDEIATATPAANAIPKADGSGKLDGWVTHTPLSSTAPVNVTKATASAGSATDAARQDHKHDITTAAPAATGVATTSGDGSATTLARSDHSHQSNTAPVNITKAAAVIGTSGEPARADHKHDVSTAAPTQGIGGGNTEGAATTLARSNHDHTIRETAGPTNLTVAGIVNGSWVRRSGTTLYGFDRREQYASAEAETSTTAATPQQKLRMTTPVLEAGTYRIMWSFEYSIDDENQAFQAQVQIDDATTIYEIKSAIKKKYSEWTPPAYYHDSGFWEGALTAAAHNIDLDYWNTTNKSTYIQRTRLSIWRVS